MPTGAFAVNPVNGKHIPIWIADYVLASYGTGAVFACPADDERDHAFAPKFGLPIIEVVARPAGTDVQAAAYTGDGPHVNSGSSTGSTTRPPSAKVIAWLAERGLGEAERPLQAARLAVLAPALLGRAVPDGRARRRHAASSCPKTELPVVLPQIDEYKPTPDGKPPLARAHDWLAHGRSARPASRRSARPTRCRSGRARAGTTCASCRRTRDDVAWDADEEQYWMPVDLYVGGTEHAMLHLLYARFWHKVLFDAGLVSTKEPFQRLFHQGMIHKTSFKDARGKYHAPDEVEHAAASRRSIRRGQLRRDQRVDLVRQGHRRRRRDQARQDVEEPVQRRQPRRHVRRVRRRRDAAVRAVHGAARGRRRVGDRGRRRHAAVPRSRVAAARRSAETDALAGKVSDDAATDNRELERALHAAIKKVTQAVTDLRFNTAIAEMMVFVNEATKATAVPRAWFEMFVKILSPFAPHLAEELWQRLGHTTSIAYEPWPAYDEAKLARDVMIIAVQVSGKLRGQIEVAPDASEADILAAAKADAKVQAFLAGKPIKKAIYVKGRLVNLVV